MLVYFINSVTWLVGGVGLGIMIRDWQKRVENTKVYVIYLGKEDMETLEKQRTNKEDKDK